MLFANCHNHSTFSDGVYTPEEIVSLAKENGYRAIVLTDHDTVQGTYFMQKAARKAGLLTLLGCEFTTIEYGTGFHLLGFDFNPSDPQIQYFLQRGAGRERRRSEILLKWAHDNGRILEVTWDEVCEKYPYNDYLCNDHIFQVLVQKGVKKPEEYFSFFQTDFRSNPEREKAIVAEIGIQHPSTKEVIAAIRHAGGVPILAHPHNQMRFLPDLIEAGLMGMEANHPDLTDDEVEMFNRFADEHNLYKLGGTDHSGVLGGYAKLDPSHECDLQRNNVTEESFMKLYRRTLG